MSDTYIALLRAVYRSESDAEAILVADQIKVNGERDLEQDEGDTLDVLQVTQNAAHLTPEQTVILLRRARNALIRQKTSSMIDCAREMDKCIHTIAERTTQELSAELARYDYGSFLEVCEEVFAGGNPVHV